MLPIVDKPIVQYVVEDAVRSGIETIILVTGSGKRAVEDHFGYNYELQHFLKEQGKEELREEMKKIADMANFIYIRQKGPYGNGTPVLCAKHLIGDEPFGVMWGDEFFYTEKKPQLKQLMERIKFLFSWDFDLKYKYIRLTIVLPLHARRKSVFC